MIEYKKTRSKFWLKIFDDEATHTNISANKMVMGLLQEISPHLISCSPKGWKESSNIPGNYNLWIPNDRMDWEALENVETWAERANQHIWLGTNKNTAPYFCGDEVDYCLAADWNIDLESQKRTIIGEAEYQLKYNLPKELINKEDAHQYASLLTTAVLDCIACLPINPSNFVVVSIPATEEKQKKLAWKLAKHIAKKIERPFIKATLKSEKPQMKEQTVEDKVRIWRKIFCDEDMLDFSDDILGANILIIDDLYQSGASIWCFAEYLKECCDARTVIAITPVKALKDGGNK
mgnify:FL=1